MWGWLSKNWGLKLVSLTLAVGLWYYALGEEGIEVTRVIPLRLEVKNAQISVLKASTDSVEVTFLVPRAVVSEVTSEAIEAVHEIGTEVQQAGDYSFRLEPSEIRAKTPQARIMKIEPEVVQVTLDELIVQKLPVKPQFVGDPAFGYKIETDKIELNPNAALVEGPKGQLEKLPSVQTEKITLVGRTRPFRQTAAIELPPYVKLLSEPLVDIYVPIREEYEEKTFDNVPVKVLRSAEGDEKVGVDPEAVSLVLQGAAKHFERLIAKNLIAYVDVAGRELGEHKIAVHVVLPEGVSIKGEDPVVKVQIRKK